jgi:hypothetical protein
MPAKCIYKIIYVNQGKVYEIYARSIAQSSMHAFIEVEDLVFGEQSTVVIDPGEEKLKSEFAGVKRSYIPMHAIIRIDEVEKEGTAKIVSLDGKVTALPGVPGSYMSSGNEPGND